MISKEWHLVSSIGNFSFAGLHVPLCLFWESRTLGWGRYWEPDPGKVIDVSIPIIAIAIEMTNMEFFSRLLKLKSVQRNVALTHRITTSHTANKHSCLTLTFIPHKHSGVYVALSYECVLFSESCCHWCLMHWGSGRDCLGPPGAGWL